MLKIALYPVLFLFNNQLTVNQIEIKTKQKTHTEDEERKTLQEKAIRMVQATNGMAYIRLKKNIHAIVM